MQLYDSTEDIPTSKSFWTVKARYRVSHVPFFFVTLLTTMRTTRGPIKLGTGAYKLRGGVKSAHHEMERKTDGKARDSLHDSNLPLLVGFPPLPPQEWDI
jgi:hypothetical protein